MEQPPATSKGSAPPQVPPVGPDLFELPSHGDAATSPPPTSPEEPEEEEAPSRSWREELRDVDWEVVRSLWSRELLIAIRSRAWMRLLAWFAFGTALLALLPILYRLAPYHWKSPDSFRWLQLWSLGTAIMLLAAVSGWTRRGIARELRGGALEEITLTGSGPADILLGKSLAAACLTSLLVLAAFPSLILAVAIGGREPFALLRLALTLGFCAYLGLCLGMEYSFRKPGSRSTIGRLWTFFYVAMVAGNLARFVNWSWLTAPRRFLIAYNPLSTLMAAGGGKAERWPLGILLFFLLLVLLTLISFRLLRREWAEAAAKVEQGGWMRRALQPTRRDEQEPQTDKLLDNPIQAFDEVFGYRVRIPRWGWITGIVVTALLLLIPKPEVGRLLFALLLWGACWTAAHNGCASFAREREAGRWEELALLPLTDREIAHGKLAVGTRTWMGLALAAVCCLVVGMLWARSLHPLTLLWGLASAALVPWGMKRLGALIGLLTVNPEEAQWRVSLVSTFLPALLAIGNLAGFQITPAAALSPSFAAVVAIGSGAVSHWAWVGSSSYVLLGAAASRLVSTHLRRWALPAAA